MSESLEFYVRDLCWGLTPETYIRNLLEIYVRDFRLRFMSEIYISDLCQIYIMSEIYGRDYIRDYVTCVGLQPATLFKKILRHSDVILKWFYFHHVYLPENLSTF